MRTTSMFVTALATLGLLGPAAAETPLLTPVELDEHQRPILPDPIPEAWLAPDRHPRLVTQRETLDLARHNAEQTQWGQAYLEDMKQATARFIHMSETELRDLVPPPDSLFVAGGIGKDLDPINHERLSWRGWDHPFEVEATDGAIYPNDDWPDDGQGAVDPDTGERYYFIAVANGELTFRLTRHIIPQLGYAYSLTGEQAYAEAAAILLDELAAVYPTSHRGPLDYPQGDRLETEESAALWQRRGIGGRLAAANYMASRQLTPLVHAADLIASSGVLEEPSQASEGESIREHIIRNIFWDGATFVHGGARFRSRLTNGLADYIRGAATVGALLGVREFTEPLFAPEKGLATMLENNIDRDGLYWESATSYSEFSRRLYHAMAEIVESMRWQGWPGVESAYKHPKMDAFLSETFNVLEVGGQLPSTGDSPILTSTVDPMDRGVSDRYRRSQLQAAWIQAVRSPNPEPAEQLLRDSAALNDEPVGPHESLGCPMTGYFFIYHVAPEVIDRVRAHEPRPERFETDSIFHGGKGLALLRGGEGSNRYGAQLMFGPMHVHADEETLTWTFFARGSEWSMDPGHTNSHFRYGWTTPSIAHQAIVVNQTTFDTAEGAGHLRAWHHDDQVQLAWAAHPDAYHDHGVTRYERLIAQVHDQEADHLGYWLDLSRVEGGQTRDDSFHTQMRRIEISDVPLRDMDRPSLGGDEDFSRRVRSDYRIEGYEDRHFRWTPPGHGYKFLGQPRVGDLSSNVELRMNDPAFADTSPTIAATLLGQPGRKLIVADGPKAHGRETIPSVPYVLSRDEGEDTSVFAKIIRFIDEDARDPIAAVESIPAEPQQAGLDQRLCHALIVQWVSGRKDLWIVADGAGRGDVHVNAPGLGDITTDALVAVIRFDPDGRAEWARAANATHLTLEADVHIEQHASPAEGAVQQVHPHAAPVRLAVDWSGDGEPAAFESGHLVIIEPIRGQPSTWELLDIDENQILLQGAAPVLARTQLTLDEESPGKYHATTPVSRFQSLFSRPLPYYARGKPIYDGEEYLGRVDQLIDAANTRLRINNPDGQPLARPDFEGWILEIGPDDWLRIVSNLTWQNDRD